jgi:hypothetical protein
MSTTAESLGIPADMLAQWRLEMAKVTIPDNGASFAHIQCRHAALWAATFVLLELAKNELASDRQRRPRSLIYVLPNALSVMIAKDFLEEKGGFREGTLRVLTYVDIQVALGLPQFSDMFRSAVIVFDTDFGRVSTALLAISTKLFGIWARLKAEKEPLSCTAVTISSSPATLWEPEGVADIFGSKILDLNLGPDPQVRIQPFGRSSSGDGSDGSIARLTDAILSFAQEEQVVTVVCLVPSNMGMAIKNTLEVVKSQVFVAPFVLTNANFADQWSAIDEVQAPALVVLLPDPYLRFLPAIEGRCHYVLPQSYWGLGVDPGVHDAVRMDLSTHFDDACLVTSMGQGVMSKSQDVLFVADGECTVPQAPPARAGWPAWGIDTAETVLSLIDEVGSLAGPTMLASAQPDDPRRPDEALRRLRMMKLVEWKLPIPGCTAPQVKRMAMCGPHAKRALSYLNTRLAPTLPDALLLSELASAPSTAVKLTLAAVASAARVGIANIVSLGPGSDTSLTLAACRAACTGPGAQLSHKGRLWVAIGILAVDIARAQAGEPRQPAELKGVNLSVSCSYRDDFLSLFQLYLQRVAPDVATSPFPDSLTDAEILAVDTAITRAWLQNLAFKEGPDIVQFLVRPTILHLPIGGWGVDLPWTRDCRFAIHFGLRRRDESGEQRYGSETLTLVSNDAVCDILVDLFGLPTSPDGKAPNYMHLFRTSHSE